MGARRTNVLGGFLETGAGRMGVPVPYRRLGTDLEEALAVYDAEIVPLLEAWRENALAVAVEDKPVHATLSWMLPEYRKTDRYKVLCGITQRDYDRRVRRCCKHVIRSGRFEQHRFGDIPLPKITQALADQFYSEHVVVAETGEDGKEVERRRSCTAKLDVEALRAMVNALKRKYGNLLHNRVNPFEGMFMHHRGKGPVAVTLEWLGPFVRTADAKGLASVSAIALFAWEMQVRVTHFPHTMSVADFCGPNHENQIRVVSHKNHQEAFFYIHNDDGKPLYPALTLRLIKLKGSRTEGPLFVCERAAQDKPRPWTPSELRDVVAEVCRDAGLPHLTLTQFRKGGLSESGAAGLSPWQIVSQSLHLDPNVLKFYIDCNADVAMGGQELRLDYRGRKAKRGIDIVT